MNTTRVLLLCSSRLALPALQQLAYLNVLAGVVVPQHCDEWLENVQYILQHSNIPVVVVNKANYVAEIQLAIEKHEVAIGFMVTFSFRIPASVYQMPVQGFFNVHPGPLPQYRGADPVFQQIKNREKQAAITLHYVAEGYDTGAIVLQDRIRLHPTDTYGMLTSKLGQVAAQLILLLLKMVAMEVSIPCRPQDEAKAVYYKRHGAKDVNINWQEMDDVTIIALMNACNPWNKGATTLLNGKIVRLIEAQTMTAVLLPGAILPGTILGFENDALLVATKSKAIGIKLLHIEEGFLSGNRLSAWGFVPGQCFETLL